jgi:hypothetical protein
MFRTIILLSAIALLAACSGPPLTVPYIPEGTAEVDGKVKVETFAYEPPEGMKPNV